MKFLSSLALFAAIFTTSTNIVDAHSSIKNPLPRGHPLNPNAAVKDFACITTPLNGGPGCAPKAFPCGGYPQDTQITQVLTAGEVISVNFWNPNFPNGPQPGDESRDQARHNGGQCEFALSYDGGVTYTVIGTYHETCPDIFFDWKVKIPENAPSCDKPGKCLFSWSWINAVGNREFYQNCADVKIVGNSTKPLPIKDITRANLPPQFPTILTPTGDPSNNGNLKGSGPLASDVSANLQGAGNAPPSTRVLTGLSWLDNVQVVPCALQSVTRFSVNDRVVNFKNFVFI
ncbi:12202_t:CDS:2 [Ambispora leptoticha]|uniref:12202_t:CDS:1 n=1 Tax=Ambispora leptoticha TaxID=144679 RepID=A0A9N9DU33_9GLOM|nr:12202_t:CDS:2 [Ambispora leptoticha]